MRRVHIALFLFGIFAIVFIAFRIVFSFRI